MPTYQFRARDPQGAARTGSIEADSQADVESRLARRGLKVERLDLVVPSSKKAAPHPDAGPERSRPRWEDLNRAGQIAVVAVLLALACGLTWKLWPRAVLRDYQVTVSGSLSVPALASGRPPSQKALVAFLFPEGTPVVRTVVADADGKWKESFQIHAYKPPRTLGLTVRKRGYVTFRVRDLKLESGPVLHAQAPAVTLSLDATLPPVPRPSLTTTTVARRNGRVGAETLEREKLREVQARLKLTPRVSPSPSARPR